VIHPETEGGAKELKVCEIFSCYFKPTRYKNLLKYLLALARGTFLFL